MITFNDVRRTDETTFTFIPDGLGPMTRHFLDQAGISYRLLSYNQTRAAYPDMTIPAVPYDMTLMDDPDTYCKKPILVLSDRNAEDLQKKIYEIKFSPEGQAWKQQWHERLQEGARRQLNHTSHWQETE